LYILFCRKSGEDFYQKGVINDIKGELLYCCIAVLLYCCIAVLLYCCIAVLLYCCI
jgi:hypothetical protein